MEPDQERVTTLGELLQMEPSAEDNKEISDYEKDLFKNGKYKYDKEQYDQQMEKKMREEFAMFSTDEDDPWDMSNYYKELYEEGRAWSEDNTGIVPSHWNIFSPKRILEDIQGARNANVELSDTLVDAAISFPPIIGDDILHEIAYTQILNDDQLEAALSNREIQSGEIFEGQENLGVSVEKLNAIEKKVTEEKRKISD